MILKQNFSFFISLEMRLGIYSNKDISEVIYTMGDHEGTIQIEIDDNSMKTKIIFIRFDEHLER